MDHLLFEEPLPGAVVVPVSIRSAYVRGPGRIRIESHHINYGTLPTNAFL